MSSHVLIVDSNPQFRSVIKSYLVERALCDDIVEANSADAGIERACHMDDVMVLMDIDLPHINGIEAAQLIHQQNPKSEIILFSYLKEPFYKKISVPPNVKGFVHKYEIFESLESVLKNSDGKT